MGISPVFIVSDRWHKRVHIHYKESLKIAIELLFVHRINDVYFA